MKKLGDLAQKRRGMHFALEKGLKTQRDFAGDMGMCEFLLKTSLTL